ncbi:hypothetical protein C8R41DRAFT_817063 [Lentinula lateritia]|uniref:Uncharacterized protein n=1 Tax=Lentinula lateritia TaxID=40482 RepID=A0ABQ8VSQ5_9AGAR|nr:hypothetical protein C8R41DRAFT_817063 [Lentinula lateritia]
MTLPSSPTTPRRRLSSRRGSVSAQDPYAKHGEMNLNPNRLSTSTLTIVKVVPSDVFSAFSNNNHGTISLKDPPGPGQRRPHRRIGNNDSGAGPRGRPEGGAGVEGSPRMSFAFSTFGPARPDSTGARTPSPSSPSTSSRIRPSSPSGHRSSTSGYAASKPRLTPEQLYDLAHHLPSMTSPLNQRWSPHFTGSPRGISTGTFTPLHPSVYLPFIDRSAEVKALIESTRTRKLFALLKQTFPNKKDSLPTTGHLVVANPDPESKSSPSDSPTSIFSPTAAVDLPIDPTTWTYDSLIAFIVDTSRDQEPDTIWVAKIRRCILSHSELIWERVKGAFGVPPELDVDFDLEMEMNADVFESSESESESDRDLQTPGSTKTPRTEDMEDGGMKGKGYWEGWDAIIDSPNNDPSAFLKSPSTDPIPMNAAAAAMLHTQRSGSGDTTESPTPVQRESRSPARDPDLPKIMQQIPTPTTSFDEGQQVKAVPIPDGEDVSNKTSASTTRHVKTNSRSSIGSPGSFSPSLSSSIPSLLSFTTATSGPNPETGVVIEPLILSPSQNSVGSPGLYPPPLSLPALLSDSAGNGASTNALGDILEGAEEEDEEDEKEKEKQEKSGTTLDDDNSPAVPEPAIDPTQIHGLRISLPSSPTPSNSSTTSSPVFAYRPLSQTQSPGLTGSLSRSGSLSRTKTDPNSKRLSWGSIGGASEFGDLTTRSQSQSYGGKTGLTRTGSSGSITSVGSHGYLLGGAGAGAGSGYDSEGGYDPVGDRAPGNPLFPSNFARLATGPTLIANNPALRSAPIPPQSKYSHVLHGRRNKFDRRGSNASGVSGTTSNDYALTVESGSSVG